MKRLFLILLAGFLINTIAYAAYQQNQPLSRYHYDPNQIILPTPFPVYIQNGVVVNHPLPGFSAIPLPTNNDFIDMPGCYIACYSHDAINGIYSVSDAIYVNGQVRVSGEYNGRTCVPRGYLNRDISKITFFKQLCVKKIKSCGAGDCWAGGDTGGWLGIQ